MNYLEELKKRTEASKEAMDTAKQNYLEYEKNNPFKFDVNEDALYNQAVENYTKQGQLAMKDTIGQAAALTGGYGNSYAQTAGQQVYNAYLDQANDIIPEAYQRALDRYNIGKNNALAEYTLAKDEYSTTDTELQKAISFDQSERALKMQEESWDMEKRVAEENLSKATYSGKGNGYDNGKYSDYQIKLAQKLIGASPTGKWSIEDEALASELGYDLKSLVNEWAGVLNPISASDVKDWGDEEWAELFASEDQAYVKSLCNELLKDPDLSDDARDRIEEYLGK